MLNPVIATPAHARGRDGPPHHGGTERTHTHTHRGECSVVGSPLGSQGTCRHFRLSCGGGRQTSGFRVLGCIHIMVSYVLWLYPCDMWMRVHSPRILHGSPSTYPSWFTAHVSIMAVLEGHDCRLTAHLPPGCPAGATAVPGHLWRGWEGGGGGGSAQSSGCMPGLPAW